MNTFLVNNYSFAKINISSYLDNFMKNRERYNSTSLSVIEARDLLLESDLGHPTCKTEILLKTIITDYKLSKKFSLKTVQTINQLQKKIEIFKRLRNAYDDNFRQNGNVLTNPYSYALLSTILLLRFNKHENFNDLNTALKLNDALCNYAEVNFTEDLYWNLITFELSILRELLS